MRNGRKPDRRLSEGHLDQVLRDAGDPLRVYGLPADADPTEAATLRSRLISAVRAYESVARPDEPLELVVTRNAPKVVDPAADENTALALEQRSSYFQPEDPRYSFDDLVLPADTMEQLLLAVAIFELRSEVFDDWGLRRIQPRPGVAISLQGSSGTGKTLAAHAIAHRLGRKVICAKYSQLESKYHGEGPKNLQGLFHAARSHDAVLFIDEADSMLSQRFENVSQGAEHAVNAMRSELLLALDEHAGLVILASNFAHSFDRAFESRIRPIEFPVPDEAARARLWRHHLVASLPLADDVDVAELAAVPGITGRDVRNAVVEAATAARLARRGDVGQELLLSAARRARARYSSRTGEGPVPVPQGSAEEAAVLAATAKALGAAGPSTGQQPDEISTDSTTRPQDA